MSDRTRSPGLRDQAARSAGRLCYLWMRVSLDHGQCARKSDLYFELPLLALASVRQICDEPQPGPQLRDCLDETRFRHGLAARAAPISDRLLQETRFGEDRKSTRLNSS